MSKYTGLGKLYEKDHKIDVDVSGFLDGGPIIDWDNSDSHYMTLMRYDGAKLVFWTENRWYAFGNIGRILDKNGKTLIDWRSKTMSKQNLETLADYYSGVKKPHTNKESLNGFQCSCGVYVNCIVDEYGKLFVFCESGHGGKYKLDMNPNGISTFYFE